MSHDTQVKREAPERIYTHPTSAEYHVNPWPLEPREYVEYIRADLLATVRREALKEAITDIQEARESHAQWANHLRNEKHALCEGCDQFAAHIGDAEYHDQWIAKYDNVIAVLARVPLATTPPSTLPHAFKPINDEPDFCEVCGWDKQDCATNQPAPSTLAKAAAEEIWKRIDNQKYLTLPNRFEIQAIIERCLAGGGEDQKSTPTGL